MRQLGGLAVCVLWQGSLVAWNARAALEVEGGGVECFEERVADWLLLGGRREAGKRSVAGLSVSARQRGLPGRVSTHGRYMFAPVVYYVGRKTSEESSGFVWVAGQRQRERYAQNA